MGLSPLFFYMFWLVAGVTSPESTAGKIAVHEFSFAPDKIGIAAARERHHGLLPVSMALGEKTDGLPRVRSTGYAARQAAFFGNVPFRGTGTVHSGEGRRIASAVQSAARALGFAGRSVLPGEAVKPRPSSKTQETGLERLLRSLGEQREISRSFETSA